MKLKIIKNSLFFKSFGIAKSNLGKVGLIVLFDALFLVALFVFRSFGEYSNNILGVPTAWNDIFVRLLFYFLYFFAVLFLYSFFKYAVLDFIKSLLSKTTFSFYRIGKFYLLNIFIAVIYFIFFLLINIILSGIKEESKIFIFFVLAVPFFLFLYAAINVFHSLFYEGVSIKDTIKKGFGIIFGKIKSYRETIFALILAAFALLAFFYLIGYLVRLTSGNYRLYLALYSYLNKAVQIAATLVFYFVILVNRISFYSLAIEFKGK